MELDRLGLIFLIIAIYLPPEKVYFLNPRSTMIFLAEELRDEAK